MIGGHQDQSLVFVDQLGGAFDRLIEVHRFVKSLVSVVSCRESDRK